MVAQAKSKHSKLGTDATTSRRGVSRWLLPPTAWFSSCHDLASWSRSAGSYSSSERETPRDKLVASAPVRRSRVATSVRLHDARSWYLLQHCSNASALRFRQLALFWLTVSVSTQACKANAPLPISLPTKLFPICGVNQTAFRLARTNRHTCLLCRRARRRG